MKKKLQTLKNKLWCTLFLLMGTPFLLTGQPSMEEIQLSIDEGLTWLVAQQHVDGYWDAYHGEYDAGTGLALYKLCERAYELGYEPFDEGYIYHQNVIDGFDWLFNRLLVVDITTQDHTTGVNGAIVDPDVNGNGTGICVGYYSYRETYSTGIILAAFAASGTPDRVVVAPGNLDVDGLTFGDIAQDMVDFLAFGQVEYPITGITIEGGWEYYHMDNGAYGTGWIGDQSNSGYAILGLAEAQAFGSTIPDWVLNSLNEWVDWVQDDIDEPEGSKNYDGGSWYSYPGDFIGINTLKTGNLLTQMALCGDTPEEQRVVDAVDYIVRHWGDGSGYNSPPGWDGDPANYQAMFCLMKGLVFIGIDMIDGINWFDDIATVILAQQDKTVGPTYGSWQSSSGRGEPVIITEWALLTLEKIAPPPPVMYVNFDVHPMSWPNPINTDGQGLTPTAILGTEDFDVYTIDPATLYLDLPGGMVYPVSWEYEDVTQVAGSESDCNDTEEGPDGFMDLTVKFSTLELITALGEVYDGDELVIMIKGNLVEDGLAILGDDCIWIKAKKIKSAEINLPTEFSLSQNSPNPFSNTTFIKFDLPVETNVSIKVFDLLGNEVSTLTNSTYPAGTHSVQFDGSMLENGYYIFRITTDKNNSSGEMLKID